MPAKCFCAGGCYCSEQAIVYDGDDREALFLFNGECMNDWAGHHRYSLRSVCFPVLSQTDPPVFFEELVEVTVIGEPKFNSNLIDPHIAESQPVLYQPQLIV